MEEFGEKDKAEIEDEKDYHATQQVPEQGPDVKGGLRRGEGTKLGTLTPPEPSLNDTDII